MRAASLRLDVVSWGSRRTRMGYWTPGEEGLGAADPARCPPGARVSPVLHGTDGVAARRCRHAVRARLGGARPDGLRARPGLRAGREDRPAGGFLARRRRLRGPSAAASRNA